MAFLFKDWFFSQFPEYHQANDTYRDTSGNGLLKRYLSAYGLELDNEFMPYIDGFTELIDIQLTNPKYLSFLGFILGSPPSPDGDSELYRRILAYAVSIYKIKGTEKSYQLLLNLLGLTIKIVEAIPKKKINYDDDPLDIYDDEPDPQLYDSECDYCSDYWIDYDLSNSGNFGGEGGNTTFTDENGNVFIVENPVDFPALLDKASKLLCFLQPINAKFKGFRKSLRFRDVFNPIISEIIVIGPHTYTGVEEGDTVIGLAQAGVVSIERGSIGDDRIYTLNFIRYGKLDVASTADWSIQQVGSNPAISTDFVIDTLPAGSISFGIGEQTKSAQIGITGDNTILIDHTFKIHFSNLVNARVDLTNDLVVTIIHDQGFDAPLITAQPYNITNSSFDIDWKQDGRADGATLQVSALSDFSILIDDLSLTTGTSSPGPTAGSWGITGLSSNTTYYVRINCVDSSNHYPDSNWVTTSFTTL